MRNEVEVIDFAYLANSLHSVPGHLYASLGALNIGMFLDCSEQNANFWSLADEHQFGHRELVVEAVGFVLDETPNQVQKAKMT